MCERILYCEDEVETVGEMCQAFGLALSDLVVKHGYFEKDAEIETAECLCPIDVPRTLEPLGYVCETDDWGVVVKGPGSTS